MATYGDQIAGLSTGSGTPTGWTVRWGAFDSISVATDVDAPGGKSLQIRNTTVANTFLSYDGVNSDGDRATSEVLALIRINSVSGTAQTSGGVAARGSGNSGSITLVAASFSTTSGGVKLIRNSRYVNNAFTFTNGGDASWVDGGIYWLKMASSGTSTTISLYPENDVNGTAIDSFTVTTAAANSDNWLGLFAFSGSPNFDVLWYSVGTGADTAPVPAGDSTAPTLTSPTGTQTGSTTASGTVSTDEGNGTLDAVVTTSATTPSAAQIQAGQDHTGAAAAATDLNNTVSATGVQNVSFTGLTAATTYYIHYVHEDAAANLSTAVTSASFTTAAASVKGIQLSLKQADGTTAAASLTGLYYHVWDALNPGGASDANGSTESTDGSGVLEININSFSASIGGEVFLFLYDLDGTEDKDSVCFAGRVPVADIS